MLFPLFLLSCEVLKTLVSGMCSGKNRFETELLNSSYFWDDSMVFFLFLLRMLHSPGWPQTVAILLLWLLWHSTVTKAM